MVRGNATGDVVFYGKGAGKLPTASAVVSDIIMAAKMRDNSRSLYWAESEGDFVVDHKSLDNKFYVRVICRDKSETLRKAEELWGKLKILHRDNEEENEAAFITEAVNEGRFIENVEKLSQLAEVKGCIRVLNY